MCLRKLSFQNFLEFPTGCTTRTSAGNNLETRGSAISTITSARVTRNFKAVTCNQSDNQLKKGITLDSNTSKTGISSELEPPGPESDSTVVNWASLDSFESRLLEEEVDISFKDDSLKEFLFDHHRIVKGILTKNIINFSQNVVQVL